MNELFKLLSDEQDYFSISIEKLYIHKYNKIFNQYWINKPFKLEKVVNYFKEKFNISDENILFRNEQFVGNGRKKHYFSTYYIFELKKELLVEISNKKYVKFLYNDEKDREYVEELVREIPFKEKGKGKHYFYMASKSDYSFSGLELKKFKAKNIKIDINKHFNDDFEEVDTKIKKFLSDKEQTGIIILHGKPGTGKSSYIRHLINNTKQKYVYFPLFLLGSINSPDLINFLSDNKNIILILEDCENLVKSRTTSYEDNGLVNLLNLGDGLLGDALQMKIICTFNADIKAIDKALLRKGRLKVSYEFKPLGIDKAKAILLDLNSDKLVTQPMTLSDIYNDDQINSFENNKSKGIGFDK